jgi:glyoxylate utilization-related uncharacterized protein
VFTVPDADQIISKGGAILKNLNLPVYQKVRFLILNMQMQMDLEETFVDMAQDCDCPPIIICEGGIMDLKAYIESNKTWQAVLGEAGWSNLSLRDMRYDAVIHLVTAAEGASDFFTNDSSHHGSYLVKSIEEAISLDHRLVDAWI